MSNLQVNQKDWAALYKKMMDDGSGLSYPSETIVRLFRGDYIATTMPAGKLLDIGFGNGNNTMFFASSGFDTYAVEIEQSICDLAAVRFSQLGLNVETKVGNNRNIPYPDNFFDYLVSWNVLHYEGSEDGIKQGIKEYARVLKPNGRLILSTTGPKHKILQNAKTIGSHQYLLGREDDFRKGHTHFFFDNEYYLNYYFGEQFDKLQFGRINDCLFKEVLDWYLVTGIKN